MVRPHQVYDLQGNPVGSTTNPIVISFGGTEIEAFDGTGAQASGTYYVLTNPNLGYIQFVDQTGEVVAPNESTATISYSQSTNVAMFDIDLPAETKLEASSLVSAGKSISNIATFVDWL